MTKLIDDTDLLERYCNLQGDTYKVLSLSGEYAFLIMAVDEVRGVGALHIAPIKQVREGLIDEREEV